MPDDNSFSLPQILVGIATFVGSILGSWALYRRSQTDTKSVAVTTAQTTVQSTLDAMKTVIDGLTRELERRQQELDETRTELKEMRIHERALEQTNNKQEIQIATMTEKLDSQQRQLNQQQVQINRLTDSSGGER